MAADAAVNARIAMSDELERLIKRHAELTRRRKYAIDKIYQAQWIAKQANIQLKKIRRAIYAEKGRLRTSQVFERKDVEA